MRGKQDEVESASGDERITPACAGKTVELFEFGNAPEDHPRVCGENASTNSDKAANIGSPPRVRGKR